MGKKRYDENMLLEAKNVEQKLLEKLLDEKY